MQFLQAEEGTGTESTFISKYLSPNCVERNTVSVLYNLTNKLSTYKKINNYTKKAGSPRTGQPTDQSLPFKREQWNAIPESGGNRGSRACTRMAGWLWKGEHQFG